jgi:lipoate-protein ligase A
VDLNYGTATKEYIQQQNCFATATGADLVTTAGNKVIGSAQLRRGKALLQHGSMILNTDKQLYRQVFQTDLAQNLCELIPQPSDPLTKDPQRELTAKIVERLVQAASAIFKIDLVKQPLSTMEWQDIANTRVE